MTAIDEFKKSLLVPKNLENDPVAMTAWYTDTARSLVRMKGERVGDVAGSKIVRTKCGRPFFIRPGTTADEVATQLALVPVRYA